ncbi:MAG: hypothetical protein ACRDRA_07275 [Pseudonocardiaceae bacterium]
MTTLEVANPGTAATWAAEVDDLRRHTRHARETPWSPLLVFGLVVLAGAGFGLVGLARRWQAK